jgi:hypothetical protein
MWYVSHACTLCLSTLQAAASLVGHFLPQIVRKKVLNAVMRPFADPAGSVNEDIWLLRHSPLMPADIPIHGLVGIVLCCACACAYLSALACMRWSCIMHCITVK